MPGPVKRFLMIHVVPTLGLWLIRVLGCSWRFRETRGHIVDEGMASGRPLVAAFLHGRTFQLLYHMSTRGPRFLIMCSKSLDGEVMARIERALGYEVVRGSSGRGGVEALVTIIRAVKTDPTLCPVLAVDGSKGPRAYVKSGVISTAQRTGGLILPVAASAKPAHVFKKTWDRTALPAPFSKIHVVFGDLIEVPPKLRPSESESLRAGLEETLHNLQREADTLSGFQDREFLKTP